MTKTIGLDTSIGKYRAKRDFSVTSEPPPGTAAARKSAHRMFVVQKHAAHRAGLHWDFRLEHGGTLWSWAVPKGPSLDPADKRMAIHVEDHPIDYADFQGTIPAGEYGGGAVETWDRGIWEPIGDPDAGMRNGDLKFDLNGQRLNGRFTLVRLHQRDPRKQEAWFLIKGHDDAARAGASAPVLEQIPLAQPGKTRQAKARPPARGAVRGRPPDDQAPQLCKLVESPPEDGGWVNEIKFDGYRLLARKDADGVRLITRNGHDWADRLPAVAKTIARLKVRSVVLDGELVALRPSGVSSFPDLQAALSAGRDAKLYLYVFDLLELDGWDLRNCQLVDRKMLLENAIEWTGMLRFSGHAEGNPDQMRRNACKMDLEGVVCKKADAPYQSGRGHGWLKLKCTGRDELIVLGWTLPGGSRKGIGSLHLGYFDPDGALHYAGAVGTGFSERELAALRTRLEKLESSPPEKLLAAGDPIDSAVRWVRPEMVVEVQYSAWSGSGRVRHPVYLGLREDKSPAEVVREVADPGAKRSIFKARTGSVVSSARGWQAAIPPIRRSPRGRTVPSTNVIVAKAPKQPGTIIAGVELSHPDKELWPGITKLALAAYWRAIADHALSGLVHRPLSIVRCPDGVGSEHFFQKNGHGHLPQQIREGSVSGSPYIAVDDVSGLVALAQMSAIELHPWGASESDPLHPDWLVFDLDPGEGVDFGRVVEAALDVRMRLKKLSLTSFCRTTGGKGLHVVVPLVPSADWDAARGFARAFAELMAQDDPKRFLAHLKIADRHGRILVDWLRNGMGATAVASYCPRARPGASVATPLAWAEVKPGLDPAVFTILSIPQRLGRQKKAPWHGFGELRQELPQPPRTPSRTVTAVIEPTPARKSSIVFAPRRKR